MKCALSACRGARCNRSETPSSARRSTPNAWGTALAATYGSHGAIASGRRREGVRCAGLGTSAGALGDLRELVAGQWLKTGFVTGGDQHGGGQSEGMRHREQQSPGLRRSDAFEDAHGLFLLVQKLHGCGHILRVLRPHLRPQVRLGAEPSREMTAQDRSPPPGQSRACPEVERQTRQEFTVVGKQDGFGGWPHDRPGRTRGFGTERAEPRLRRPLPCGDLETPRRRTASRSRPAKGHASSAPRAPRMETSATDATLPKRAGTTNVGERRAHRSAPPAGERVPR